MEKGLSRYFIAVVISGPAGDEALALKNYFKEKYNSKASLNSPPHITLHMPFLWKQDKEALLMEKLKLFKPTVKPFTLQLRNFNAFVPKVIFIDVEENESLKILQRELMRFCKVELNLFNADYKDRPFHPHVTLAFRDLRKPMFTEAWSEFQQKHYEHSLTIDRFSLLKHDGRQWQVFKEYGLEHGD
jgi:2'-5' RNA ligase